MCFYLHSHCLAFQTYLMMNRLLVNVFPYRYIILKLSCTRWRHHLWLDSFFDLLVLTEEQWEM